MIRRTLTLAAVVMASAISSVSAQAAITIEAFSAEAVSTLAGAHADVSTSFQFESVNAPDGPVPLGGDAQNIVVTTPPGLVGDPSNYPKCPRALLSLDALHMAGDASGCPADTQVGEATVDVTSGNYIGPVTLGVYNIQSGPDEPAMLGIEGAVVNVVPVAVPIQITASAHDHYTLTATIQSLTREVFDVHTLGSTVTLWGIPAAHQRCNGDSNGATTFEPAECVQGAPGEAPAQWKPFMENPTGCATTPLARLRVNTYGEPEVFTEALAESPKATDCEHVPFAPSISLAPETSQADAPTSLNVDLTTPESNDPFGRGTAELEKAVVTLPTGMTISPSAASAPLEGCTDGQFGAGSDSPGQCPAASVIGEDEVESPLLPQTSTGGEGKLTGKVYLGQPLSTDPTSGQMFRVFQELRGFGLDVKVQGSVVANPETGQLTATFANLPELPFQNFRLHFRGGPNAVLVNPPTCGSHTTTSELYPYSGNPPATPSSTFTTTYGGGSCPSSLPFSVSSGVSTASSQAGSISPLSVTFSRNDETQPLGQIDATLPQGLLGYVSEVPLCEARAALAGTCGPESRIGSVTSSAGAGPDPLTVTGSVYLARGTNGYPFMLSVVVPAVAGPYNLGNVVVPVYLQVNSNGSITALSGPLPSILDGVPLDIRTVTMTLDRPGFTVNPTSCGPLSLTGIATSLSGTTSALSAPFSVSGCASLPFAPSFTVSTQRATSKANGTSLAVRVSQSSGQANIKYVRVQLPKALPSRLTTLQKACTEAQFAANPAGCPHASFVGTAVAYTPLLNSPLTGPAILVSHGGEAFPNLEIVLQGEGVTIDLVGNTNIKGGITTSTFASVPDAPISGFELNLPEGPYSVLGANVNLCEQSLVMPTMIVGQNNATVTLDTHIAVTGCAPVKVAVKKTKVRSGKKLVLTVKASAAGRLTISGGDVRTTHSHLSAGTRQLTVTLSAKGRIAGRRRRKIELRVGLQAERQAVATTTSVRL